LIILYLFPQANVLIHQRPCAIKTFQKLHSPKGTNLPRYVAVKHHGKLIYLRLRQHTPVPGSSQVKHSKSISRRSNLNCIYLNIYSVSINIIYYKKCTLIVLIICLTLIFFNVWKVLFKIHLRKLNMFTPNNDKSWTSIENTWIKIVRPIELYIKQQYNNTKSMHILVIRGIQS